MANKKKTTRKAKTKVEKPKEIYIENPIEVLNEPKDWTIITALDHVLLMAEDSKLSNDLWASAENALAFLREKLGLTNMQIVVIAIMVEMGEAVSWKRIGEYLGCSRLSIMVYSEEIEELVAKRWIIRKASHEFAGTYQGFALTWGVVTALRHNKTFVPEKIDELSEQQFVDRLESYLENTLNNNNFSFSDIEEWLLLLVKANPQLPLCQEILKFDDIHVQSLLLMIVFDYAQYEGDENEGLTYPTISMNYPNDFECNCMRTKLKNGTHPLIEGGYIEHKCVDGQANTEQYVLTRHSKSQLLSAYEPSHSQCSDKKKAISRFLKNHTTIKEKTLFFNTTEQDQIERLTDLLSQNNLPSIQQRLEEQGMRKGFACLFYGLPGTGKTETVLQIARQTGRDIMQIDIAGLRDKFVGESEKNIKGVFSRYRKICARSEVMPILFFNEADGIFGKRTTIGGANPTVEKMDNAMQNIILQELENLDGILIATTNLTCNLDPAFERRFLYKVEFHKPDTDVKTKIWCSMLKDISSDEAHQLATRFDFSGGQIENIARKRTVDYILSGKHASLDEIKEYCRAEQLNDSLHRSIGFIQ